MNPEKQLRYDLCMRLEEDYRDRFVAAGVRSFNCWANRLMIAADLDFGSRVGRTRSVSAALGERRGWLRKPTQTRSLAEAEAELRQKLDEWLVRPPWQKES